MEGMKATVIAFFLFYTSATFAQKKFSEGSIVYNVTVNTSDPNPKLADGFDGATNTVYIKGKLSRTELVSVFGTQSTIIDGRTGNVSVLKEYGDKIPSDERERLESSVREMRSNLTSEDPDASKLTNESVLFTEIMNPFASLDENETNGEARATATGG